MDYNLVTISKERFNEESPKQGRYEKYKPIYEAIESLDVGTAVKITQAKGVNLKQLAQLIRMRFRRDRFTSFKLSVRYKKGPDEAVLVLKEGV